jgi:ABC-type transport system involved in multi-copper enzyme maturation permease subunit
MFGALFIKEWKQKALTFFFGLGILVLFLLAHLALPGKRDLLEWLTYALLLLFFPFMALILGSSGFESEFRNGSWAYLFSRPINKATIWLAKYAALLSMLAALWLVFLALWLVFPWLSELAGGTRVLLGFRIETGFPFWSLLQSVFLLTVAFSLSILHEKQSNILFLSLIVGLGLTVAVWLALNSKVGQNPVWSAPSKAITTFLVSQILIALAFAGASILTFARSDFSQAREKTLSFLGRTIPLVVLALAGTAAWAVLVPGPGERYLYSIGASGGEPYYITERGVFKYSATKNRVQWLAKTRQIDFFLGSVSSGKIAYTAFDIRSKTDVAEELWVANSDGTGRKRVLGRGSRESGWPAGMPMADLMISPDGAKIVLLTQKPAKGLAAEGSPLWILNMDGTGLENLPADPVLLGLPTEPRAYLHFVSWVRDVHGFLILQRGFATPGTFRLWLYDLKSRIARIVLENGVTASWQSPVSPGGDFLAIKYQKTPGKPWTLALLDLKTLETTDITGGEDRVWSQISWDQKGDRMAYIVRRAQASGPDVYVLAVYSVAEKKTIAETVMTSKEESALLYSPTWLKDGARLLILDRPESCLKILGPDLSEVKRIMLPAWIRLPAGLHVVGDQALVEDEQTYTLWRLDLNKETWKKIYQ